MEVDISPNKSSLTFARLRMSSNAGNFILARIKDTGEARILKGGWIIRQDEFVQKGDNWETNSFQNGGGNVTQQNHRIDSPV
ncbi:hypothetical protein CEXT_279511 [Caerostris extrusa]|uniref:Uncharacterized protein n=1 Tax=Caerostris extrusa TaxID=172846 RepID=A0AAV4S576_CAEEX|nr:hypothetical protein CEXT_279511 [Caerostris extrusa]